MSLYDCRGRFANGKEMTRRRSGAASRDIDATIHKTHRQACIRINQHFLNYDAIKRCAVSFALRPSAPFTKDRANIFPRSSDS